MIVNYDYKFTLGQWHSLIKCDNCGKEKIVRRYDVMNATTGFCRECICSNMGKNNRGNKGKIFNIEDYKDFASKYNLTFIESKIPKNYTTKCLWQCDLCGYRFNQS